MEDCIDYRVDEAKNKGAEEAGNDKIRNNPTHQ